MQKQGQKQNSCFSCTPTFSHFKYLSSYFTKKIDPGKLCIFFQRVFKRLRPLPRQHLAAIGRSENGQPKLEIIH